MLIVLLPMSAMAQDDEVDLLAEMKVIECREKIMSVNDSDISKLAPNEVIKTCQGFPMADDVAVQVLGALVGPDFVSVLDVLSSFTGEAHGFSEDDVVFSMLSPLHTVLLYFNMFVFGFFLFLLSTHIAMQVFRWQRGDIKLTPKGYLERYGTSNAIKGFLAFPFLGWMNPIQFIGLLSVTAFLWVSKMAVAYLFLASFFSNVGSTIKDSVEDSIKKQVGASILNYTCDIEQREALIRRIQESSEGGSDMAYVKEDKLYKCLMGEDPAISYPNRKFQISPVASGVDTFLVTPSTLYQTERCVVASSQRIRDEWGENPSKYTSCGKSQISLPVGASQTHFDNAIAVYMKDEIEEAKRNVALKLREMMCREGDLHDFKDGPVEQCFVAQVNGNSYSYDLRTDPLSDIERLAYHSLPLSTESTALLKAEVVQGTEQIRESMTSNVSALMQHLSDVLSLLEFEGLTDSQQEMLNEKMEDWQDEVAESGSLGVNKGDVDNVIMAIRRGVWSSGTLFFGDVSDSMDDKQIVESLAQVYKVDTGYGAIDESRKFLSLLQMVQPRGDGVVANAFKGNIAHGVILPRLGIYLDNIECWHDQVACETPALNPFTELSKRGIGIIDHASYGIIATKSTRGVLQAIARKKLEWAGYDVKEAKKTRMGKYMIFDTFEEIYLLYLFIGFVMVVILPGIPLLKITTMLVSWIYDIIKELLVVTLKIVTSPHSHIDEGFVSDEVKEAFQKMLGLGLYFLFFVVGIIVMFVMFSFLYALNILVVGALNFVVQWSMTMSSLESMVMGVIMDTVIVGLLIYEVRLCTPYIEKLPKEMAEYFNLNTSNTDGLVKQAENVLTTNVFGKISSLVHNSFR